MRGREDGGLVGAMAIPRYARLYNDDLRTNLLKATELNEAVDERRMTPQKACCTFGAGQALLTGQNVPTKVAELPFPLA